MTMTMEERVTFVTGFFNTMLPKAVISSPISLILQKDGTVNFATLDGKYFTEHVQLRSVCQAMLDQLFNGYMTLQDFAEQTHDYFKSKSLPSYFVIVNTKPFGQQKYFEKRYYIAEMETEKDLQIEVTQIGQKKLKVIEFILHGEKKKEFNTAEEAIPLYVNLYVQLLCDIL